jgi:hypothetical protein
MDGKPYRSMASCIDVSMASCFDVLMASGVSMASGLSMYRWQAVMKRWQAVCRRIARCIDEMASCIAVLHVEPTGYHAGKLKFKDTIYFFSH